MEAEGVGADEGSGVAPVFPENSSPEVKPDEARPISGVLAGASEAGMVGLGLGGDIGAGSGNTEDLEMEYFKPDAEAVASKPEDEADALLRGDFGAGNGKMGDEGAHTLEVFVGEKDQAPCNGNEAGAATLKVPGGVVFPDSCSHEVKPDEAHAISGVRVGASEAGMDALGGDMDAEDLKVDNFKPDAEAATGTPADEADIDALLPGNFGAGNGKMDEEGVHTLEVTAVEMDQDPCNGNEAGAATLKVPGWVVSMVKDDVGMETLGAQGTSPSLRADMSSVDTISDPESHKGRLLCSKQEEQIESEVTALQKAEDELLRIKEELDCKQNQLLKREQDQRLKEEEWKLLQCKEEKALKEIEARTLRQIQLVQQMEATVSRKVEELAQTEEKLGGKYKQLNETLVQVHTNRSLASPAAGDSGEAKLAPPPVPRPPPSFRRCCWPRRGGGGPRCQRWLGRSRGGREDCPASRLRLLRRVRRLDGEGVRRAVGCGGRRSWCGGACGGAPGGCWRRLRPGPDLGPDGLGGPRRARQWCLRAAGHGGAAALPTRAQFAGISWSPGQRPRAWWRRSSSSLEVVWSWPAGVWPAVVDLGIPHRALVLRWRKWAALVFSPERCGSYPGSLWSLRRLSRGRR
ncbi:hypothetical protein QYE76_042771 [Lolium multiflorum]|uniref:Uncharacterized protein n=1 Tax=Lolium multiflorum TaxID=4521 RepID=A0AAD8THS4_LOLMU|nr:hypothetical protein QYE76_042771 [Lolium multiflorum]